VRRTRGARDQLVLAMVLRENDQHFGNIALTHIDTVRRSAEFAILVGEKNFWSKGYGEEAGRLLLDHGFFTLNLHRICCGTFSTNVGMQRLAEKLGMQLEGRRREAAFKDNQWLDILEYGVLREEHVERFGQPARG
jgi:RimJ/RimL family protein N-acetyltransferase